MSNIFDYVLFWHGDLSSVHKVTAQSPTLSIQQGVSIPDAVCEETSVSVSLS